MQRIPLQLNSENYEITISLDSVEFVFAFKLNGRANCSNGTAWYIDVLTVDAIPLRMGIRMVIGTDLFSGWNGQERPAGILLVLPKGSPQDPPTELDVKNGLVDLLFVRNDEFSVPEIFQVENPGPVLFA